LDEFESALSDTSPRFGVLDMPHGNNRTLVAAARRHRLPNKCFFSLHACDNEWAMERERSGRWTKRLYIISPDWLLSIFHSKTEKIHPFYLFMWSEVLVVYRLLVLHYYSEMKHLYNSIDTHPTYFAALRESPSYALVLEVFAHRDKVLFLRVSNFSFFLSLSLFWQSYAFKLRLSYQRKKNKVFSFYWIVHEAVFCSVPRIFCCNMLRPVCWVPTVLEAVWWLFVPQNKINHHYFQTRDQQIN